MEIETPDLVLELKDKFRVWVAWADRYPPLAAMHFEGVGHEILCMGAAWKSSGI